MSCHRSLLHPRTQHIIGLPTTKTYRLRTTPMPDTTSSATTTFASWNILADGLSEGEFMTNGGDHTCVRWENRGPRVQAVIEETMNRKRVDILATQENDHFWSLLHNAQKSLPHLRGVLCVSKLTELTNAEELFMCRHIPTEDLPAKPAKTATPDQNAEYARELYSRVQFDERYSSYEEEHVPQEFVDWRMDALGISSVSTADSCICPDGLGVFYDSRVMRLVGAHGDYTVICDDAYEYKEKHGFLEFLHLPSRTRFLIAVAHLKSGENAKAERKRAEQMQQLVRTLDDSRKHCGDTQLVPIILMDSNTNNTYQEVAFANDDTLTTVDDVLDRASLVDVVDERAQCVKMRHAQGGQPHKFGELFVDGIDKCIVPERLADAFRLDESPLETFQRIPEQHHARLSAIRNNEHKRQALKLFVIEHQFGDNMRDNCFRSPPDDTEHPIGIATHELCESLLELYPNDRAPSDHPPVVVQCNLAELVQLCVVPEQRPWQCCCECVAYEVLVVLSVCALCVLYAFYVRQTMIRATPFY